MAKKAANRRRAGQRRSHSRSGAARPRQPRPLPQADSFATPAASSLRETVERKSATMLVFLHRLPRWVPAVVVFALLIAAFALQGVIGGIFLVALAAILGWLAYISWPTLKSSDRALRTFSLVAVCILAGYFIAAA